MNLLTDRTNEPFWWRDEQKPRNPFGPNGSGVFTYTAANVKTAYVVEGGMDFPVEMLRYDRAFCMTPIPHPEHGFWNRRYRVVVGFAKGRKPTVARWESFSWQVGPLIKPVPTVLIDSVVAWSGTCHSCGHDCGGYAMSVFNKQMLCSDCDRAERAHPDFEMAWNTFRFHLKQGDFTFPGVGWPGHGIRLGS